MNTTTTDPAALMEIHARRVCHEAGHAVAAVHRGGQLLEFSVPFEDFSGADLPYPQVTHTIHGEASPFVTFGGPWAAARFCAELGEGDLEDLLEMELDATDTAGGDLQKLEAAGFDPRYSAPLQWAEELEQLWPAIQAATNFFLERGELTTEAVCEILDRY